MKVLEKIFGTHSEREVKLLWPIVKQIEALRPQMVEMSDEQLKAQTQKFKERLAAGETLERSVSPPVRRWTTFCRRHLPRCARRPDVSSAWSITRCS